MASLEFRTVKNASLAIVIMWTIVACATMPVWMTHKLMVSICLYARDVFKLDIQAFQPKLEPKIMLFRGLLWAFLGFKSLNLEHLYHIPAY